MIYTDGIHLIGDSAEQLNSFAVLINLSPGSFVDKPDQPHYNLIGHDLMGRERLTRALNHGAQMISTRVIIQILRYQTLLQSAQSAECELDGWATRFPDCSESTREIQKNILDSIQPIRPDPYRVKVKKD